MAWASAVRRLVVVGLPLAPALLGCNPLTGPQFELVLATVDTAEAPPIVPDTVMAGVPFQVEVLVQAGCFDSGPLRQELFPTGLVLTPYVVLTTNPEVLCTSISRPPRSMVAELTWPHPYDFEVLVYAFDGWTGAPLLLRYPVTVVPGG